MTNLLMPLTYLSIRVEMMVPYDCIMDSSGPTVLVTDQMEMTGFVTLKAVTGGMEAKTQLHEERTAILVRSPLPCLQGGTSWTIIS